MPAKRIGRRCCACGELFLTRSPTRGVCDPCTDADRRFDAEMKALRKADKAAA